MTLFLRTRDQQGGDRSANRASQAVACRLDDAGKQPFVDDWGRDNNTTPQNPMPSKPCHALAVGQASAKSPGKPQWRPLAGQISCRAGSQASLPRRPSVRRTPRDQHEPGAALVTFPPCQHIAKNPQARSPGFRLDPARPAPATAWFERASYPSPTAASRARPAGPAGDGGCRYAACGGNHV